MSKVMNYVTKEGLEKMKAELELLESIERPKITQQIAEARDKEIYLKMQNMTQRKKRKVC